MLAVSRSLGLTFTLAFIACVAAQQPADKLAKRYGFDANLEAYPQAEPQQAVRSVVKAVKGKRVDYLVAQLADPDWVDRRVTAYRNQYAGGSEQARTLLAFNRLVKETEDHFLADPSLIRDLLQLAAEGEWDTQDSTATAKLKGVSRLVFLRKLGDRWFLENKQQK